MRVTSPLYPLNQAWRNSWSPPSPRVWCGVGHASAWSWCQPEGSPSSTKQGQLHFISGVNILQPSWISFHFICIYTYDLIVKHAITEVQILGDHFEIKKFVSRVSVKLSD